MVLREGWGGLVPKCGFCFKSGLVGWDVIMHILLAVRHRFIVSVPSLCAGWRGETSGMAEKTSADPELGHIEYLLKDKYDKGFEIRFLDRTGDFFLGPSVSRGGRKRHSFPLFSLFRLLNGAEKRKQTVRHPLVPP
jgi:hypothetical protein